WQSTLCYSSDCFFFQAEDGIRDFHVTGVQTCALPISPPAGARRACGSVRAGSRIRQAACRGHHPRLPGISKSDCSRGVLVAGGRSEERRVGKECRCQWEADDERKRLNEE